MNYTDAKHHLSESQIIINSHDRKLDRDIHIEVPSMSLTPSELAWRRAEEFLNSLPIAR